MQRYIGPCKSMEQAKKHYVHTNLPYVTTHSEIENITITQTMTHAVSAKYNAGSFK